jgi:protein-disulfide isomerase
MERSIGESREPKVSIFSIVLVVSMVVLLIGGGLVFRVRENELATSKENVIFKTREVEKLEKDVATLMTEKSDLEDQLNLCRSESSRLMGENVIPTAVPQRVSGDGSSLFDGDVIKFGRADSKNVFVIISDPSCPYCHIAAGRNLEISQQMGSSKFVTVANGGEYIAPMIEMRKMLETGKAGLIYLYQNGHGNGELAMKALYCAHEKGKFWQVHDKLMTDGGYKLINNEVKNDIGNLDLLTEYLKYQIDPTWLDQCLKSGKYDARIKSDVQKSVGLGASGTPTFIVNGKVYGGAYSWVDMEGSLKQ